MEYRWFPVLGVFFSLVPARTPKPKFLDLTWKMGNWDSQRNVQLFIHVVWCPCVAHINQDTERQDGIRNIRILDIKMQIQTG